MSATCEVAGGAAVATAPPAVGRMPKEPIPVTPFLKFCEQREAQLKRELDEYPAICHRDLALPGSRARLVLSLGWEVDTGTRKLNRWANPDQGDGHSGWVDRAEIEDALRYAGVDFYDIYPDVPPPRSYYPAFDCNRLMTEAQLIAAHTIYVRAKMTVREIAAPIKERFGYRSLQTADVALRSGWRSLGLPLRRCAATTRRGGHCHGYPLSGVDHCRSHRDLAWPIPAELLREARLMHERGMFFYEIGAALLSRTPYRDASWFTDRLSRLALSEGWHRTAHLGRPRMWPA
jgi:hypothetical protein